MKTTFKIFILLLLAGNLYSQNFTGGFSFCLPGNDTSAAKFLPVFPAKAITNNDFIKINSNGNFTADGKPVKFWGTNLVASGAFPALDKAYYVAGRLRKLGHNLVRFHHLDNSWSDATGGSLFANQGDTRHLNASSLDRLEKIISELKKNGIYANINLNVGRVFKKADGIADADSLAAIGDYCKGITIFDPQMIALQKEYAQQLLTHLNKYTGLPLVNDPVMAMVEVINENSLYRLFSDNRLKHTSEGGVLTWRYKVMLDTLWNRFLINKYKTTQALADKWASGSSSVSNTNLIKNGDFEAASITTNWTMELHEGAAATMSKDMANAASGNYCARINVTNVTGTDWHMQWKQTGFTLKKDSLYRVEFSAKADGAKKISASVMRDNSPYNGYGGSNFDITPQWSKYSFTIKATEDNIAAGRLTFSFNNTLGTYYFDDIKLTQVSIKGLEADETLEQKTVRRIEFRDAGAWSSQRVKDMSEFYITLQDNFMEDMKSYLKNTLGVKVPVFGTNWNVGPGDLISQEKNEFIDNHAYWQHPNFPNEPWSSTDWVIPNTSMLKAADGGTMASLFGGSAFAGKPYTVSEYNHPFPNSYLTEMMLFSAAYFSFHGADGIEFFDHNGSGDYDSDKVPGFFDIDRNNALMSLMPSCALAYRNGMISKAKETIKIKYTADDVYLLPKTSNGNLWGYKPYDPKISLIHDVRNETFRGDATTDFSTIPSAPAGPYKTDTDEIIWNTSGLLTVNTPSFAGVAGFMDQFPVINPGRMTVKSADGFGTVTWVSLTGDSLASAGKSLLTISSRIQNSGMVWDGTTTVHNNWGRNPTEMQPLKMTLRVKINADSIRIYPLDIYGREILSSSWTVYPVSPSVFEFTADQSKDRTLWFGIERFGKASSDVKEEKTGKIKDFSLEQNYPNPFNNSTVIRYALPYETHVKIDIFDALGRKVAQLADLNQSAGTYTVRWEGKDNYNEVVRSGLYFIRLKTNEFTKTIKTLLMK